MTPPGKTPSVSIVGGGLAGLAAGCALADAGLRVSLFERRPYLGGRASSYQHPGAGEVVDNCQHVLLGCCTNLLDFYRRIGVEDRIAWYDRLVFIEPGGRQSVIQPSVLPAPFHSTLSFLGVRALSWLDKLAIAGALMALLGSLPLDDPENGPFLDWLRRHRQTERAIERFWKPILVSALNEDLDRVSSRYAAQVLRESFLKSAQAGRVGLPTVPLSELYSAAGEYISARGGQIHLRAPVTRFEPSTSGALLCAGGQEVRSDYVLLTVPFQVLSALLPAGPAAASLRDTAERLESSPITGVHFWFDREITDLDHAVLLDRTIQWMFHKSRIQSRGGHGNSYVELVVSASRSWLDRSRAEIEEIALRELQEFFPAVKTARLLKSTVIKEVHATYAPVPGADRWRPGTESPWPRVFLAGDWIGTGWPSTMEGAVRSGYLAAESLALAAGVKGKFMVPDLPARGFMRLFGKT